MSKGEYKDYITEARRYLANAKNILKNSKVENGFYRDVKYVRMACGVAYSGVLMTIDGYLLKKAKRFGKGEEKALTIIEGSFQKLTKRCLNISTQRTIYYTFRVIMMERIGSALYPMA
jgi:hypothetical protein